MLIAIGVVPGESGEDAMALGGLLCRTLKAEPLLIHIHPAAYDYASPGHVDAEWDAYLREETAALLEGEQRDAEQYGMHAPRTAMYGHRSSGVGLAEAALAEKADLLVIGSAPSTSNSRFQIGSTADQLLHGSHVPVALAPSYYSGMSPDGFSRIVTAFQNTEESRTAVLTASGMARQADLPLMLLTVLLRHRIYGSKIGRGGEETIIAQLSEDIREEQQRVISTLPPEVTAEARVAIGDDAYSAFRRYDWDGGELLVLASARGGTLRRVFLGDMTYKLIRASTVPMIVLPRHT